MCCCSAQLVASTREICPVGLVAEPARAITARNHGGRAEHNPHAFAGYGLSPIQTSRGHKGTTANPPAGGALGVPGWGGLPRNVPANAFEGPDCDISAAANVLAPKVSRLHRRCLVGKNDGEAFVEARNRTSAGGRRRRRRVDLDHRDDALRSNARSGRAFAAPAKPARHQTRFVTTAKWQWCHAPHRGNASWNGKSKSKLPVVLWQRSRNRRIPTRHTVDR